MPPDLFAPDPQAVVRVALPLPTDRLFEYAVPPELARAARPGCRVRVRAGGRALTGVIVEGAVPREGSSPAGLRRLDALLDETPVLAPGLLAVLREEAREVLCPLGIALAAALPAGSSPRAGRALALTARGREALLQGLVKGDARRALEALEAGPLGAALLRRRAGSAAAATADMLRRDGLLEHRIAVQAPALRAARVRQVRLSPGVSPEDACRGPLARAPRQAELLRHIARAGTAEASRLSRQLPGAADLLRALLRRGLVQVEEHAPEVRGTPAPDHAHAPVLTPEQDAACRAIDCALAAGRPDCFLLHGVTGSGKTEVYLRSVARALARGRQALVLVPEITLTHQIVGRLRARFGNQLAVLHSGLRPAERLAQWERLREGATPIAVGARSALFAPLRDLGLVVLDEEHDPAYKSEDGFRYHARSLALRRARADGCPLVLGSATPSLETRHAADTGRVQRLVLERRIGGRPLPAVTLVDLARERAALPRGRKLVLSSVLRRALRRTLEEGGQAILFLNRRGFSTQITCFECHHVMRCKHCDIALTYHAGAQRLRCHYCDFQLPPPDRCPSCGSPDLALLGLGTERLAEEVREALPEARVARLDRDVSARRGATAEVLDALRRGEIDVLVGTQMVAKGHDFPGVRLVGVVNADLGLHFPDFRAGERTFQLLTQVAGRAGRGAVPGEVVIQTYQPDHYAIGPVVDHDYERFYAREIAQRRQLGYPPFGQVGLVRVSDPDEGRARATAERLARAAREAAQRVCEQASGEGEERTPCEVLGPAAAPIARLRGRHRVQLLLRHPSRTPLLHVGRRVQAEIARLSGDARASIDLRPIDML